MNNPPSNADVLATAIRLHSQHRSGLDLAEIHALLTLGLPVEDRRFTFRLTYDKAWINARATPAGEKPIVWVSEMWVRTPRPARVSVRSLEHGPDDDEPEYASEQDCGTLDDLPGFLAGIDHSTLDPEQAIEIEVCGWVLWTEGLL